MYFLKQIIPTHRSPWDPLNHSFACWSQRQLSMSEQIEPQSGFLFDSCLTEEKKRLLSLSLSLSALSEEKGTGTAIGGAFRKTRRRVQMKFPEVHSGHPRGYSSFCRLIWITMTHHVTKNCSRRLQVRDAFNTASCFKALHRIITHSINKQ